MSDDYLGEFGRFISRSPPPSSVRIEFLVRKKHLFNYITITRNLYQNSDVMLKATVKMVVDMVLLY